ncbi:hypothetical protein D4R75_13065 [bacterium]|nr:MAG: hypothetical protein D4R75_13065 [bacterium]
MKKELAKNEPPQKGSPWYKKMIFWFNLVFVLFMAYWILFPDPRGALFSPRTQMLFPVTTKQYQAHGVSIHNSYLMTFLEANLARQSSEISSRENTKAQTRLFYAAILAAVIAFFSLRGGNSHPVIVVVPMVLIVSMYVLEIHQDDLNRRSFDYYHAETNAIETLVDLNPTDTTWYRKEGDTIQHVVDSVHNTRVARKIQAAFHPSLDQIIFYFIPLFLVTNQYYYVILVQRRKPGSRIEELTRDKTLNAKVKKS